MESEGFYFLLLPPYIHTHYRPHSVWPAKEISRANSCHALALVCRTGSNALHYWNNSSSTFLNYVSQSPSFPHYSISLFPENKILVSSCVTIHLLCSLAPKWLILEINSPVSTTLPVPPQAASFTFPILNGKCLGTFTCSRLHKSC